ncbi:MAG: Gfo/Idh/MocA family protein [Planctomycetota bacterium]
MSDKISRRTFAKAGAAVSMGWTALSASRVKGANQRIRLGFIGVANRGGQLIRSFMKHDDVQPVAVCDVHQPTLEAARKQVGGDVDTYGDFRRLLKRDDLDAVVIATPDHWHAIMTIDACAAGKDVYVEKPLSKTIHEGRRMGGSRREGGSGRMTDRTYWTTQLKLRTLPGD